MGDVYLASIMALVLVGARHEIVLSVDMAHTFPISSSYHLEYVMV